VKVFMLGWEFPPVISGGLGVACYGLVKALNASGVDVMFVLPRPASRAPGGGARAGREIEKVREVEMAPPAAVQEAVEKAVEHGAAGAAMESTADEGAPPPATPRTRIERVQRGGREEERWVEVEGTEEERLQRVTFVPVDSPLVPYQGAEQYQRMVVEELVHHKPVKRWEKRFERVGGEWVEHVVEEPVEPPAPRPAPKRYLEGFAQPPAAVAGEPGTAYGGDLFTETERYARLALSVAKGERFDVVHAHDWMTFEAGMAVAAAAGKPLVVQIHSTEIDRAGMAANQKILEIEREGMLAADRILAVSEKTKSQLVDRYGIDARKIEVVYNAAGEPPAGAVKKPRVHKRTVLFLGRLARQKGPDYFLRAAQRVLALEGDVRFIVAGQGEMLGELKKLAGELGIRRQVTFTGFVDKKRAAEVFGAASVYVMPSVSEPFGIAPLEALSQDVPVIISRQSGVAEVLKHVLKVDFWDTDELANKILAVLRHPPLAETMSVQGRREAGQFSWAKAAEKVEAVYEKLAGEGEAVDEETTESEGAGS
jgi:glycosyltransferase involved in cell wall biosynthesis